MSIFFAGSYSSWWISVEEKVEKYKIQKTCQKTTAYFIMKGTCGHGKITLGLKPDGLMRARFKIVSQSG